MSVQLTLIIVASVLMLGIALVASYAGSKAREAREQVVEAVNQFVQPGPAGEPSQLALFIQSSAHVAAQEIASSMRASLMGQASGLSRGMDAIQEEAVGSSVGAANPMLGALLQFSPSLRKKLGKLDPGTALSLVNMVQGKAGIQGPGGNHKSDISPMGL